uniref:Reverse transcriptase domain-containing protein n=1 Tax=Tanacetum cinerariifolium TaxID=118510 RepID=A0A699GVW9_TANCI|nr:reverse transcriptase domain-containing protein [Tanacetum cinerariifolium]
MSMRESKARTTLLQSIPNDHVADFHYMDDAGDIWIAFKARFGGNVESKKMRKSMMKQEFLEFRIGEAEGLHKGTTSANKKMSCGDSLSYSSTTTYTAPSNSKTGSHKPGNIEKLDLEKMDLKWQMDMLSVRVHKFDQKAGRKIDFDKKESGRFDKKVRCYKGQQRGHFARECRAKGGNDKQRYSSFKIKEIGKKEEDSKALITVDTLVDWTYHNGESDGVIASKEFGMIAGCDTVDAIEEGAAKIYNLITGADTEEARTAGDAGEFSLMGVTFERVLQRNQLTLEDKIRVLSIELENTSNLLKNYERINADVETSKKELQTIRDNHLVQIKKWIIPSKNLFRLHDSSMSVKTKVGLGFNNYIRGNELGWDDSAFSVFTTNSEDVEGRPLFNRFAKADSMKVVPPPLSRDYTSLSDYIDLDESQMSYGIKSLTSSDSKYVSNNFVSCDNSDKSSEVNTNDFASIDSNVKSLKPKPNDSTSCASTSSEQMVNKTVGIGVGPVYSRNKVNHQNQFIPQAVLLRTGKLNIPPVRPQPVPTGKRKLFAPIPTSRQNRPFLVPTDRGYSPSVISDGPLLLSPQQVVLGNHIEKENPFPDAEDEGFFDSGCFRSMTGNKERLDDFQVFQGGKVTFGGREDFKLPDESMVVLRVPRKNNLYTINLNNLCPGISSFAGDKSSVLERPLATAGNIESLTFVMLRPSNAENVSPDRYTNASRCAFNATCSSSVKRRRESRHVLPSLTRSQRASNRNVKIPSCMCTRSSSNVPIESSPNLTSSNPKRRNRRRSKQPFILKESPVDTTADQHTMAELLRAPIEGYAEAIVVPPILAEQFELKHSLITMMTSNQFFGLEKDNPQDHIRWFNKITSTIKYKDVPNLAIKLMLFPFSLVGAARRWLEKEPPHSVLTWEDFVSNSTMNSSPSKTTNVRNEISNFQQQYDESFNEAWDRYKDLLRACPHHGFIELHQLDTFYNALNPVDQDSLNSGVGGNLLEIRTQDMLTIIENKSKVGNSRNKSIISQVKSSDANSSSSSEIAKLTHAVNQQTSVVTTAMPVILKQFQATLPPAFVKSVEEICVTCSGAHPYYQCLAADGNTFPELQDNIQRNVAAVAVNYNQGNFGYRPSVMVNQIRPYGFAQPNVQIKQIRFSQPQGYNRGNNFNQDQSYQTSTQQNQVVLLSKLEKIKRMNEANMKSMQTQINNVKNELRNEMKNSIQASMSNQTNELKNMMASFFQMNTASTSGSRPLPSNTIANPKAELKAITTQSGIVLYGPFIPIPSLFINPEEDERLPELISTRMTLELANRAIYTPAGIAKDVFVPIGKFTFPADLVIIDYESDTRFPLILGRPFLRTAHALIDVHGEEMILRDGDERLTLNMRHDTSSYSNEPKKESINMINICNDSCEDFLEDLFATNHQSGNPTFSSHTDLTSPEVKDDIFDLEGGNVLIKKLLDLDSTKYLPSPYNINPLSGSTTSSSPNHLLEEFAGELALVTFPPGNDDFLFDIESNLKEIEYLLKHDYNTPCFWVIDVVNKFAMYLLYFTRLL